MNRRASRRFAALSFSLAALVSVNCRDLGVEPVAPHIPDIRGFCYTSFAANGFAQGTERNAVGDLTAQTGTTWIALSVFEYQSTSTTSDIGPNTTGINPLTGAPWSTTSTEDDLREGIRQARLHQLRIMLKPHIDLYSGEWRALIRPDSRGDWFRTYTAMIARYARLAAELNVEMLCIGTEFVVATQPPYTSHWRAVIDSVRSYFGGALTYAANWNGAYAAGITEPEFEQIEFWDRLDYVGVDWYYPLATSPGEPLPSVQEGVARIEAPVQDIWAISARVRRSVILTEVGIQSVRGALASPWDFTLGRASNAVQDNAVQELYYRAIIEALGKRDWCAGVFWWTWDSVPSSYEAKDYTPRNKPAAVVVRQWYGGSERIASLQTGSLLSPHF